MADVPPSGWWLLLSNLLAEHADDLLGERDAVLDYIAVYLRLVPPTKE